MTKGMTTYSVKCGMCQEVHYIVAHERDVKKWLSGTHIQDAMPYLSPDDRELLISRTCPTCWVRMFGEEE